MIRYDKWRFDDRRFGGLTTQSEKKSGGDFIRTREMPQEVWVTGQGGQTQQWVLHCSDGAYSNSSIGKYYGPLVLPKSPHRGWLSCREAGWNNRLGEPLDMLR